jgi:hypothetical protein
MLESKDTNIKQDFLPHSIKCQVLLMGFSTQSAPALLILVNFRAHLG